MEGRRYPEGGTAPTLEFPSPQTSRTPQDTMRHNRRNKWYVPVSDSELSDTTDARDCFVMRKNSKTMQQFLLNYAYTIATSQVLSGEI